MSLENWYDLAGIGSFIVALGALIGLIFYALDTRQMRFAAQEQLETSVRPCVLFTEKLDANTSFDETNLVLKNVGAGVALNIRWRYRKLPDSGWAGCPALAPGDSIRPIVKPRDVLNGKGIECEFSSLSGTRYRAISCYPNEAGVSLEIRHEFERVGYLTPGKSSSPL